MDRRFVLLAAVGLSLAGCHKAAPSDNTTAEVSSNDAEAPANAASNDATAAVDNGTAAATNAADAAPAVDGNSAATPAKP